jgi:hypothetical protein
LEHPHLLGRVWTVNNKNSNPTHGHVLGAGGSRITQILSHLAYPL